MSNDTKEKFKENWKDFKIQGKQCIKELLNKETRKKQIPNMFTASRLLAPFFIIPVALCGNIILTAVFSIIFALTDAADGFYAKKFKATSEFGRKLDPITDKVFAGSLLIPLIFNNPLTIITFILEGVIALINTTSQFSENNPYTVSIGRIKTAFLYSTIVLSYISLAIRINPSIINYFVGATTLLQGITAYQYYQKYVYDQKEKTLNLEEDIYQKAKIEEDIKLEKENKKILTKEEQIENLKQLRSSLENTTVLENDKNKEYIIKK